MAFAPFLVKAAVLAVKALKAKTLMGSILRAGLQMGLAYGFNAVAGALSNNSVGRLDDGTQTTKWEPGTPIPRIYGGQGGDIRLPPANLTVLPSIGWELTEAIFPYIYTFRMRATWTRSTLINTAVDVQIEYFDPSLSGLSATVTIAAGEEESDVLVGTFAYTDITPDEMATKSSFRLRVGNRFTFPDEILWAEWKRGNGVFPI